MLVYNVNGICLFQRGKTPLHHAAMKGHADVVELLLNSSADVNREDKVSYCNKS